MRVGIDIDGVLADFYSAYERLCIEVGGEDLFGEHRFPKEFPCTWNWPQHYGYSEDVVKDVWKRITTSRKFWRNLNPLPEMDTLLQWPFIGHEVYFITARPGIETKFQTERWFDDNGWDCATVLISDKKGLSAAALDLDVYIDDKWENVLDVAAMSAHTKVFLLDRPYNAAIDEGYTRVATLKEALQYVR